LNFSFEFSLCYEEQKLPFKNRNQKKYQNKTYNLVLPGISWIDAQTDTMEVDGGFEVLDIPEDSGAPFDRHDLAVQACPDPILSITG